MKYGAVYCCLLGDSAYSFWVKVLPLANDGMETLKPNLDISITIAHLPIEQHLADSLENASALRVRMDDYQ